MLSYLPKTAAILELGSAHGRDADYIESLGYKIYRTDAVKAFVDYLQAKNHDASVLNAIDGKYPKKSRRNIRQCSLSSLYDTRTS
jgi:hypothetical protein